MHPPIHFAYILILPSCFTLWSCIWKAYLNMHCSQPSLIARYGTGQVRDMCGPGTGQEQSRVIRHHLPLWWRQKKNGDVIKFSIFLFFSGTTWDSNPHYRPTCIPPYTSHSYSFFQVASRYDLAFESPIWIVRPAVFDGTVRYGTDTG